jgi:hypothetical protein
VQHSAENGENSAALAVAMMQDYRRDMQRALRSIKICKGSFAISDTIFFEDLQTVPWVSLKKIGRIPLPIFGQHEGERKWLFVFLLFGTRIRTLAG